MSLVGRDGGGDGTQAVAGNKESVVYAGGGLLQLQASCCCTAVYLLYIYLYILFIPGNRLPGG